MDLAQYPSRLAAGAFTLNSGLEKWKGDEDTANGIHGFAAGTYPFLRGVAPTTFLKALAAGEIAIGAAALAPVVPRKIAGLGIAGFGAGLLGLYLRTPGMRKDGSLAPTQQGLSIAKDVWLLGIGLSLLRRD